MRYARYGFIAVLLLVPSFALAGDGGRETLDEALVAKLTAESMQDFDQVIELCDKALAKGLEGESQNLAHRLIASTSYERAKALSGMIFVEQPDRQWPQMRAAALEDLVRATSHMPELLAAWQLIARLELLPGGNQLRARMALDEILKQSGDDKDSQFEAYVMRAATEEPTDVRMSDLNKAIELKPEEPTPFRMRGALHLLTEEHDEALADFAAALKLDSKHAPTYEAHGRVLELLGRYDEARDSFDRAVELAPKSVDALLERAQLAVIDSDYQQAIEGATKVLEIDMLNIPARLLRAQARMMLGKLDEALEDTDRSLELSPDLPQSHRIRAEVLIRLERFADAIHELETVRARDSEEAVDLQFKLALLYRSQKNFRKALELLNATIQVMPENGMLRSSRADALLSVGRHEEAIVDLNKAVELRPKDTGVLNNLAWLLATSPEDELRDGDRAVELATQAVELTEEKEAHILSTLAAAYAETGDFDKAREWSKKAVEKSDERNEPQLRKELASYEADKPWRERLTDDVEPTSARAERPATRRRRDVAK